jgi:hypothetical protein
MKPALVFPYADPDGRLFPHVQAILPDLKEHFECAYICPPLSTLQHVEHIRDLQADDFFRIFLMDQDLPVGKHFTYLYERAAQAAQPDQVLHLCFVDRLAFAMEGEHKNSFLADVDVLALADTPLIFQRSQSAWDTHPQNYRQIEGLATSVGRNLFDKELDYAWCHLAVRAKELREIMPRVQNLDLSMMAEIIFYLQDHIHTRDVDWLTWEDPFLLARDAAELKRERENSLDETNKRLRYVIPMIETLTKLSRNGGK